MYRWKTKLSEKNADTDPPLGITSCAFPVWSDLAVRTTTPDASFTTRSMSATGLLKWSSITRTVMLRSVSMGPVPPLPAVLIARASPPEQPMAATASADKRQGQPRFLRRDTAWILYIDHLTFVARTVHRPPRPSRRQTEAKAC